MCDLWCSREPELHECGRRNRVSGPESGDLVDDLTIYFFHNRICRPGDVAMKPRIPLCPNRIHS